MKLFHLLIMLLCMALPTMADATQFLSSAQDIPVMDGLVEDNARTVTYDSPQGRIVESVSHLQGVDEQKVRAYYLEALPAFGWSFLRSGEFVRQNEILRMDFVEEGSEKYFRIFIEPR